MKRIPMTVVGLALATASAHAIEGYQPVSNSDEVRSIMSDAAFLYKKSVNVYYRKDGNMAEHNADYNLTSIRKWKVDLKGRVCLYVFSKPDRLIDCFVLHRSESKAKSYYITWPEGAGYPLEPIAEPPADLIKKLNAKTAAD